MLRWLLAATHLLALGVGLGAVWSRGLALRNVSDAVRLRRVFYADTWWGIAALLWISTGLIRAFSGLEKGSHYYLHNYLFWGKMTLLGIVLLLELAPMTALIRWRIQLGRGQMPDTWHAARFARVSFAQAGLVVLMVLVATGMARGYGVVGP